MKRILVLLAFSFVLAAASIHKAHAAESYDLHVILPLTGGGAFVGNGHRQSLDTLAELVNKSGGIGGRPLHFVYHDDQSSPKSRSSLPMMCSPKSQPSSSAPASLRCVQQSRH
jgi:branched-chain amino acid transport system substrate-binding protein